MKQSTHKKINAYFIILMMFTSLFPIPIASAATVNYNEDRYDILFPTVGDQLFTFNSNDENIQWSISSLMIDNTILGKNNKPTFENLVYTNAFQNINADIRFEMDKTSVKQIIEMDKSQLPVSYTKFQIFETFTTSKSSNNWYVDLNTNEMAFSTKDKDILAKELYFGDNRLHLKEPKAWDNFGNIISGYYDIKYNSPSSIALKTVFLKTDIDTLSGTIYFDPTIENGFTGTTTTTHTSQSGNQSFSVPDGSSYDINITNNQLGMWELNGRTYENKTIATINGSMVTTETNIPLQAYIEMIGNNGSDIAVSVGGIEVPKEVESNNDVGYNVSTFYKMNTTADENTEVTFYHGNAALTEPAANSTYGSQAVWDSDYVLVAHMNNDPNGDVASSIKDSTVNAHHGTPIGSMTTADLVNTAYGKAIDFDNVNDRINFGNIGLSGTIGTLELRMKIKTFTSYDSLWTTNHGGTNDAIRVEASATPDVYYYDATTAQQYLTVANFNNMYGNMAIGWTGTNVLGYSNGINNFDVARDTTLGVSNFDLGEGYAGRFADMIVSDVRGSTITRSSNWLLTTHKNLNNPTTTGTTPFYLSIGEPQQASGTANITASITGDSNTQSYNTSQSREFTLTPTSSTNNVVINTTSTDYDVVLTTYWTDDTWLIEETDSLGYVKQYINYTASNNATGVVLNTTITHDFTSDDSIGTATSTVNGNSNTTSRTLQEVNASVGNVTAGVEYYWNVTIPYNNNLTASVSEQTFSTTQDVSVTFIASDPDSNTLIISGTLNGTTKTTTSPHNFGLLPAGTYTYYLNVTEDATINPHTENLTATINVIQNYGSVPSIQNGVYAYHYDIIPSESQILARQTDGLVTVDIPIDFDVINATTWTTILSRISYAYDNNIRISLHLDVDGAYTSQTYIDGVKSNISTYLSDLTSDPYQANTQFLTLNFTNTSALDSEKVSFANTIGVNVSDSTNSKFRLITREQLTGLDSAWVENTPIKYIDLSTKLLWIDSESTNYRASITKSRMYTGVTTFISDVTTYRNTQLMKSRGASDVGDQYPETSTVKITNGDIILYNNDSSAQNMTIQSVTNGTYFDLSNDVYFNLSATGELYFTIPAESISYILKDSFDRIVFNDNTSSTLVTVSSDNDNSITYGNTLNGTPPFSYLWGGENSDLKFEFYDPYYTTDNTYLLHYEWMNASVITDYTPYDYVIIADQNAAEITSHFATTNTLYGYVAVADYGDSDAWYNSKILEVDTWVDTYDTNIFIDGIDFGVGGVNFSSRFKDVVNYIRVTKGKEAIINTYTAYEEFATYGDMVMKESAFSRWDGTVGSPTYSYEDMTIEKERADFYTSQNIPVLGMSFGAVDDYSKQAFTSFAFAVLYGFDGENSWRYGQPNFQAQKELSIYPFGTMLEDSYTEHSATDWSRLYSSGRVHINPIDHTYSIEDNIHVNSIKFNMSVYSGGEGSGDRNVYVYVNDNKTPYTIPYNAGVDPVGVWTDKELELSTSEYNTTGHYSIYAYTIRSAVGGWNFIGEQNITGIGTHTWYDTSTENIPTSYNQTWIDVDFGGLEDDRNFMVSFATNLTTSATLDDIANIITQSDNNLTYNTNTTINSSESYGVPFWSGVVTITDTFTNASTYFQALNGTWVEASVNTVTDITADVIDWAYTTIDSKIYGVARQLVSATEYIYRYLFPSLTSTQSVYTEMLPTIQNLISTTDIDHIHFDWDDYTGADYFNIYELEESAPYIDTSIVLDGLLDSVYTDYAHGFVLPTPNQVSPSNFETVLWFRNSTHLIGYATGFDNDNFNNDDYFKIGIDITGDGLTADDRKFILRENNAVTAKRWSGSWLPQATTTTGVVVGAGVAGAISYEMIIPLSELTGFVDGVTSKFFMERTCTALNPTVQTFFPETLHNTTDASLWASVKLTIGEEYDLVGNSTTSDYDSVNLTQFTWYKHKVVAVNGVDESQAVYSTDITLDEAKYTITGTILDDNGNPISNATVYAMNGHVTEADVSDVNGVYNGEHFHNGSYTIYANATGYDINSTPITIAGANLTNVNITLLPLATINITNVIATPSVIKEGQTSIITADINESSGGILSATVTVAGSTYIMHSTTGDTWSYTWTAPQGSSYKYFITSITAIGTYSTNVSAQTAYIDVLSSTGSGGNGGGGFSLPPVIDDTIEAISTVTIPQVSNIMNDTIALITNVTKSIDNIFKADTIAFIGIKYTVSNPVMTRELVKPNALICDSTDPQVICGALNGVVTLIINPVTDDSKLYQLIETYITITENSGKTYHTPISVTVLNPLWYVNFNLGVGIDNPYIVATDTQTGEIIGLRMWWIMLSGGLLLLGLNRKYGS